MYNIVKYIIISIVVFAYIYYKFGNIRYNNEYYRIYLLFLVGIIFFDCFPNIINYNKEFMHSTNTNNNIINDVTDVNDINNINDANNDDKKINKKKINITNKKYTELKTNKLVEKVIDNTDEDEINFDEDTDTNNELKFDFKNLSKLMQYNEEF